MSIESRQRAAIHIASELGKQLSLKHPEIADDFRNGMTYEKIAAKLNLSNTLTIEVAANAVRAAIKKLMGKNEISEIAKEHLKKGGIKRARTCKETKSGIFAFTAKENRLHGQKSALSRGLTPWYNPTKHDPVKNPEEGDYCLDLAAMAEFQHSSPPYKGRPDINKIVNALNAIFHDNKEVRTSTAVKLFLSRNRRRKNAVVKPV